LVLVVCSY